MTISQLQKYLREAKRTIPKRSFESILKEFLEVSNSYVIYGVEISDDFEKTCSNFENLKILAKDIWETPKKFNSYLSSNPDSDSYYDFLKYLWIRKDEKECQLADFINYAQKNPTWGESDFLTIFI